MFAMTKITRITATEVIADMNSAVSSPPTEPNAPTILPVTESAIGEFTVTWVDNSTNEDNFTVERSETGSGGSFVEITDPALPAGTTTHIDNITEVKEYCYRVRASNAVGGSVFGQRRVVAIAEPIGVGHQVGKDGAEPGTADAVLDDIDAETAFDGAAGGDHLIDPVCGCIGVAECGEVVRHCRALVAVLHQVADGSLKRL